MFHFSQLKSIILIGRICPPTMISFIFSLDGISIFIKLFFFSSCLFPAKRITFVFLGKDELLGIQSVQISGKTLIFSTCGIALNMFWKSLVIGIT